MASVADDLYRKAAELAGSPGGGDPVEELVTASAGDRAAVEEARDRYARHLHGRPDDWSATGALRLLNRTLAQMPVHDPLDWKVRWAHHRKP